MPGDGFIGDRRVDVEGPAQIGAAVAALQIELHARIRSLDPQRRPDHRVRLARVQDGRRDLVVAKEQPGPNGLTMRIAKILEDRPLRRGQITSSRADLFHAATVTEAGLSTTRKSR